MAGGPWRLRPPKHTFQGLINALTWSNRFCSERGKRGGLVGKSKGSWHRNAVIITFNENFLASLYTTLPTTQGSQGTFF